MENLDPKVAQQLGQAVRDFEQRRTGRLPKLVTLVLEQNTLVVTLHGALSPAEKALASSPAGATEVQEFHRQLFNNTADELRQEIERIAAVELHEARVELDFDVGADLPSHRWDVQEQICADGRPSGVK
jgi:uncharacterized protein YbcI